MQASLFYEFRLDKIVPKGHLVSAHVGLRASVSGRHRVWRFQGERAALGA
jgi:hypothetical protein